MIFKNFPVYCETRMGIRETPVNTGRKDAAVMAEFETKKILGREVQVIKPEDPNAAPVTDYGRYVDSVKAAEEEFCKRMDEFFKIAADDERIREAAKAWEKASALLAGYAGTLFNLDKDDTDNRNYAMRLFDLTSKSAGLRKLNLAKHMELMVGKNPDDAGLKDKLEKIKYNAEWSQVRFVKTQERYRDLYEKGMVMEITELQQEAKVAADAAEERKLIPSDVLHIPGQIYPPIPIPLDEDVPEPPIPYQLVELAPAEAKVYDRELDELVIKPGYVSPDGLIDDQSVVRNREKGEVAIKFRGGEPVIWKEWKATWAGDVMEEGSWPEEYHIRLSYQIERQKANEQKLYVPQEYEKELPWYDRPPDMQKN